MSKQKFSRALKRSICIEYMQSGMKRAEIAAKYGLPNVNTLSSWINSCLTPIEIKEKCVNLPSPLEPQEETKMANEEFKSPESIALLAALEKQNKKLEDELKKAQDKILALNTLIDIAEEQGIKVRKKCGAKQ